MHKLAQQFLIFFVIAFVSSTSFARCNEWPVSIPKAFAQAEQVILVQIISARKMEQKEGNLPNFTATYELIESFKGSASPNGEVFYKFEPHSILLTPGRSYLFLLNEGNFISICFGSKEFEWVEYIQTEAEKTQLILLRKLQNEGI